VFDHSRFHTPSNGEAARAATEPARKIDVNERSAIVANGVRMDMT
jgi:hypothetical protein